MAGNTSMSSRLPTALLWLSALTFLGFGIAFFARPEQMAAVVEVVAETDTARTEIRAMYGGLEIGFALYLAWCALAPQRVKPGLLASGLAFAGIGLARIAGVALADSVEPIVWGLLAAELVAACLSFWGAWKSSAQR